MKKIQLEIAFQWVCLECGTTNFDRGEEINDLEITPPDTVQCHYCSSTYLADFDYE